MENNIFNNKLIINANSPFDADYTGNLRLVSETFTALLENKSDQHPITISIDAPYGVGKTTFIDMWGASLLNSNKWAIKFDAWRNDHSNDPLLAIVSELLKQLQVLCQQKNETLKKNAKNLMVKLLPVTLRFGAKALLKYFKVEDMVQEYSDELLVSEENEVERIIEEQMNVSTALDTFKKSLQRIVENNKLFVFIDELDRCRPLFAISILEIIKHVLDVKNVCFIISMNTNAIAKSIGIIYDKEEALAYLDRFVDIPFRLPEIQVEKFILKKLAKLNIHDQLFITIVTSCCQISSMSLRVIEKFFNEIEFFLDYNNVVSQSYKIPSIYYPCVVLLLAKKRIYSGYDLTNLINRLNKINEFEIINKFFTKSNDEKELFESADALLNRIQQLSGQNSLSREQGIEVELLRNISQELVISLYGNIIYDRQIKKLKKYKNHYDLTIKMINFLVPSGASENELKFGDTIAEV